MKKKKHSRRFLCMLLSVIMVFSLCTGTAFAEELPAAEQEAVVLETQEETSGEILSGEAQEETSDAEVNEEETADTDSAEEETTAPEEEPSESEPEVSGEPEVSEEPEIPAEEVPVQEETAPEQELPGEEEDVTDGLSAGEETTVPAEPATEEPDANQPEETKVTEAELTAQDEEALEALSETDGENEEISSQEELATIVNAEEGSSYKLAADIELTEDWTSDGTFNGTLDGDGHTITLNGNALFGSVGSTGLVKNLIVAGRVERNMDVGAVANIISGTVRNCVVTATVKCTSAWSGVGGFGGYISGSDAKVSNCLFVGTLESAGGSFGAVVGERYSGSIENCYWTNTDRAASTWMGGAETSGVTNCGEMDADAQAQAAVFNANLQDGDLSWKVCGAGYPVPSTEEEQPGGEPEEDGIRTQEELATIVNAEEGTFYKLAADIELTEDWASDGTFNGTLDGNGHTITLNGNALFGSVGSTGLVKNLIVAGRVERNMDVGAVANIISGTVRNCVVTATVKCTSAWSGVGGFGGYISGSDAKVSNCLFVGTLESAGGSFGAVVGERYSGSIENCYWTNTDRAASTWMGGAETSGVTNCGEMDADAQAQAAVFNANLQDGDCTWKVNADGIPVPVRGNGNTPGGDTVNTAALEAKIAEAQNLKQEDGPYTDASWNHLQEEVSRAAELLEKADVTQTEIDDAFRTLGEAILALEKEIVIREDAVDLTDKEVIEISAASQIQNLEAGKYYRLTADISTGTYWYGVTLPENAVLDGGGHVITLNDATLFANMGSGSVVQNLGLKGTASAFAGTGAGAVAGQCSGLIVNCWAQVNVTGSQSTSTGGAGGLAGDLLSGGAVVNCYTTGKVTASRGTAGAVAGTASEHTRMKNCYYLNTVNLEAVGSGSGEMENVQAKAREDFYDPEFTALLNANRGEAGLSWGISSEGYPYHGEDQGYEPDPEVEFSFTSNSGVESTFTSTEGLSFALLDADADYYVGTIYHPDVTYWMQTDYDSTNVIVNVTYGGEIRLYRAGTVNIVGYDANWAEIGHFTLTVAEGENVEGLRLCRDGEPVEKVTLKGSESVTLQPEVLLDGSWKALSKNNFTYAATGDLDHTDNTIYASRPGDGMTFTVSGYGQSVTIEVVSEYVPVESISVSPNGTYQIHERNANSTGMASFLDLNLAFGTGDVVVSPANASYADQWTLTSSDSSVLEYVSSMLKAVLPKKAGKAVLTAVSDDPELSTQVTDSKEVTIEYFNPVTELTLTEEEIAVQAGESIDLPLTFAGPESENGWRVTEPGMIWSYESSDGGAIEIGRTAESILARRQDGYKEYCVANDQYVVTGISAGTVTVTGTPVDQTGGAEPIVFTVKVEAGEVQAVDSYELAKKDLADVQKFVEESTENGFAYGDEWNLFALIRSGRTVSQEKLDRYMESVKAAYENPSVTELKPTTIARVILAATALGENASDLGGLDLISMLVNSDRITEGANEAIWALIALDTADYPVPQGAKWDREALIHEILSYQNTADGGFGLFGNQTSEMDATAMAVQGLAPYYADNAQVRSAVDKALEYMKPASYTCDYGTAETTAQVLIAVSALGMDAADVSSGFARTASNSLITAIDGYRNSETGAFRHLKDGSDNDMATQQCMLALEAYVRAHDGENRLYSLGAFGPEEPSEPTKPSEPEEPSVSTAVGTVHQISKVQYRILSSSAAAVHKLTDKTVKDMTVPETVTIGGKVFKVTTIGTGAYKNCTKLESVTLGKSVTVIGSEAFSGCTGLKRVKKAASVTAINKKAFYNCKKLTTIGDKTGTITLGKIKSIGNSAFQGCSAVKKVNASSTALTKVTAKAFCQCTSLTSFTASSKKLTTIGSQAFYGCKKLANVTLKTTGLKKAKVGANAFKGIRSTCTFRVPSAKRAAYTGLFKAKGAGSKIKVIK